MADQSRSAEGPRPGGMPATGRRWQVPGRAHRALKVTVWSVAGLTLLGAAALGFVYVRLDGNLKGVDIDAILGTDRPDDVDNGSMDVLVLGSDSRAGANASYGGEDGARADTAMILHISKGHRHAGIVSIPRDTLVARPECKRTSGGTAPAVPRAMFNESYEVGGPACTVKTVEKLSGIRMDHYIEVDFTGFKQLIDELGGVPLTTAEPINDRRSRLTLEPGEHRLNGEQALGLVRTRHAVGDGSDLARIELQHAFLKALIDQVKAIDLFGSPRKLYGLADTATRTVTTDSDLASVNKLLDFTKGLRSIGSEDMSMVTLPVAYDRADPNRVVPIEKQCRQVWDALRKGRPIPASATKGTASERSGDAADLVERP
ncbi:LCP family protein [Streptomyces sp. KR80]|uniref:LCP family protein n=1 Tax=Streptomyces sp. KR80 TaxID=3457426 RepID=UPI003FCFFB36